VPAQTSAAEVLALNPDGIFLSNGPGDPEPCDYAIRAIGDRTRGVRRLHILYPHDTRLPVHAGKHPTSHSSAKSNRAMRPARH